MKCLQTLLQSNTVLIHLLDVLTRDLDNNSKWTNTEAEGELEDELERGERSNTASMKSLVACNHLSGVSVFRRGKMIVVLRACCHSCSQLVVDCNHINRFITSISRAGLSFQDVFFMVMLLMKSTR